MLHSVLRLEKRVFMYFNNDLIPLLFSHCHWFQDTFSSSSRSVTMFNVGGMIVMICCRTLMGSRICCISCLRWPFVCYWYSIQQLYVGNKPNQLVYRCYSNLNINIHGYILAYHVNVRSHETKKIPIIQNIRRHYNDIFIYLTFKI